MLIISKPTQILTWYYNIIIMLKIKWMPIIVVWLGCLPTSGERVTADHEVQRSIPGSGPQDGPIKYSGFFCQWILNLKICSEFAVSNLKCLGEYSKPLVLRLMSLPERGIESALACLSCVAGKFRQRFNTVMASIKT